MTVDDYILGTAVLFLCLWAWRLEWKLKQLFKMAGPPPRKARTVEKKPKLDLLDD